MATRIETITIDDLDGTTDANVQNVTFAVDGRTYEIDLSDDNRDRFTNALMPYLTAARPHYGHRNTTQNTSQIRPALTPAGRERARAIRAWAAQNGYELGSRGAIPRKVRDDYDEAHKA